MQVRSVIKRIDYAQMYTYDVIKLARWIGLSEGDPQCVLIADNKFFCNWVD